MRTTKIVKYERLSDSSFKIVAMYGFGTSFGKSLEPTINKAFKKASRNDFGGGFWTRTQSSDEQVPGDVDLFLRTVVFTKN